MDNVNYQKYEKKENQEKYKQRVDEQRDRAVENFKKLQEEVTNDITMIEKDNLVKETNSNISIYQKYVTKMAEEKLLLSTLNSKLEVMEAELADYYRFHWDKSTKLTESAISKYVQAHPMYNSLNTYTEVVKVVIGYLDNVVQTFNSRNFAIKNIIEIRKIELGLV